MNQSMKGFGSKNSATGVNVTSIDPKLLEILVCPLTKATLEYDREAQELVSKGARRGSSRKGEPISIHKKKAG